MMSERERLNSNDNSNEEIDDIWKEVASNDGSDDFRKSDFELKHSELGNFDPNQ